MDYDGNISEALQVSNCPAVHEVAVGCLTVSQGMQKTQSSKGNTWLFYSSLQPTAHCVLRFSRCFCTLFIRCISTGGHKGHAKPLRRGL